MTCFTNREHWDDYFMRLATTASTRTTCTRRGVGCVLVRGKRIIATGYNGAPSGAPHCDKTGCLRQQKGIPSGERLDICRASHAEANAITQCARFGVGCEGATAYVTVTPCRACAKLLVQAGIERIVCGGQYPDAEVYTICREAGVSIEVMGSGAAVQQS